MADAAASPTLDEYPAALYSAVVAAMPGFVRASMESRVSKATGSVTQRQHEVIDAVVADTVDDVRRRLAELLATDVDSQRNNPLGLLRACMSTPTRALAELGIPTQTRDDYEVSSMPDDVYGIGPLTWRDLGEDVHEAGIMWGAWKAAVIISRRREEGKIA